MHATFTSSVSTSIYLVVSILVLVSLLVFIIGIIVYIRKRKRCHKKTLHKPPILRPNIYKPNDTFELHKISSSDDYLQPSDTQVYSPTVEPIYDVVT